MTESVGSLLDVAILIACGFIAVGWFLRRKSENSFKWGQVVGILASVALTVLEVLRLTFNCLNGKSYGVNILLVVIGFVTVVTFSMSD